MDTEPEPAVDSLDIPAVEAAVAAGQGTDRGTGQGLAEGTACRGCRGCNPGAWPAWGNRLAGGSLVWGRGLVEVVEPGRGPRPIVEVLRRNLSHTQITKYT